MHERYLIHKARSLKVLAQKAPLLNENNHPCPKHCSNLGHTFLILKCTSQRSCFPGGACQNLKKVKDKSCPHGPPLMVAFLKKYLLLKRRRITLCSLSLVQSLCGSHGGSDLWARFESQGQKPIESLLRLYCFFSLLRSISNCSIHFASDLESRAIRDSNREIQDTPRRPIPA